MFLPDAQRSNYGYREMTTETTPESNLANALPAQNSGQVPEGNKPGLAAVISTLKNFRELLVLAAFFGGGLGGGVVWVLNYFATTEQHGQLECFTKLNVRMLQASANANYTGELIKQAKSELRDQQHILGTFKQAHADAEVGATQAKIDELAEQISAFKATKEVQAKAAEKALNTLTQNACLVRDQRKMILDELASGKF
jgi:hypothetical protein